MAQPIVAQPTIGQPAMGRHQVGYTFVVSCSMSTELLVATTSKAAGVPATLLVFLLLGLHRTYNPQQTQAQLRAVRNLKDVR